MQRPKDPGCFAKEPYYDEFVQPKPKLQSRLAMHTDLSVRVTPRSNRNRLELQADGSLRAWLTAPPTDNQANEALCELIADKLGIANGRVSVMKGHTSRSKLLRIDGLSAAQCSELLST